MRRFELRDDLTREEFDGFARDNSDRVKTHFLGSYEWGEVSKTRNWQPHYVGVLDNGELRATALILRKPLILGYSYFYIPRGFTMDWTDRELIRGVTELVKEYGRKHRALYFKIDPDIKLHTVDIDGNVIEGESNEELSEYLVALGYKMKPLNFAFENEQPRFTFRIDISGTMEDIRSRYSKTAVHEIRKSQESKVQAYKGDHSDIEEFVRLMKMTEARQDFISHESSYYEKFYNILNSRGMADIYIGKVDIKALNDRAHADLEDNRALMAKYEGRAGKKAQNMVKEISNRLAAIERKINELEGRPQREVIVSSYLTVKYLDKIWTLYGANDMDYSRYYANYAVYDKMIEDANAEGMKVFDGFGTVGRPDADRGAIGLYEFKKKWGGELTEFIGEFDYILNKPVYYAYSKLIPLYHEMKNRKLRKEVLADA